MPNYKEESGSPMRWVAEPWGKHCSRLKLPPQLVSRLFNLAPICLVKSHAMRDQRPWR
jgi:hypothetical protein